MAGKPAIRVHPGFAEDSEETFVSLPQDDMDLTLFLPDANSSDRKLFGPPMSMQFGLEARIERLNRREEVYFLPQLEAIAVLEICGSDGNCFYRAAAHQVCLSFHCLPSRTDVYH